MTLPPAKNAPPCSLVTTAEIAPLRFAGARSAGRGCAGGRRAARHPTRGGRTNTHDGRAAAAHRAAEARPSSASAAAVEGVIWICVPIHEQKVEKGASFLQFTIVGTTAVSSPPFVASTPLRFHDGDAPGTDAPCGDRRYAAIVQHRPGHHVRECGCGQGGRGGDCAAGRADVVRPGGAGDHADDHGREQHGSGHVSSALGRGGWTVPVHADSAQGVVPGAFS
jgi:hypothetical protein